MREEKGISPIKREEIDRHLERAGFRPDDQLRWLVELALYPAYRHAHIEAEAQLQSLLFPELLPAPGTKRKLGDVFYKNWWIYIKPLVPDLKRGQAMHADRHMVADDLKDQEVFVEFRNDHLGHKGRGEGETRDPSAASLTRLREAVAKIPVVTEHLPDQMKIHLLPSAIRITRPRRKK